MQAMKCEICGSNDIVKQEGIYVCQHCGTKYTVEEAKKLIGTVKIDKTDENEKYLVLAQRARNEDNAENAIKYYCLVAENDPNNWEAAFFVPYYQCKNKQDPTGKAFANSITTTLTLIHDNVDKQDQSKAVSLVIDRTKKLASDLHYEGIIQILNGKPSYNVPQGFSAMLSLADGIKKYFSDNTALLSQVDGISIEGNKYKNEFNEKANMISKNKYDQFMREGAALERQARGCYIATCVYGSYDCPEVWTLRRYRDSTLAATRFGRAFIRTYYAISPKLVSQFGEATWFKRIWKIKLDRLVDKLHKKGFSDTPYNDK